MSNFDYEDEFAEDEYWKEEEEEEDLAIDECVICGHALGPNNDICPNCGTDNYEDVI